MSKTQRGVDTVKREMAFYHEISQRLRVVIGSKSMTTFAREIGISRQWLYDILNGKPVSLATLSSISDTTGYSLDWLARGKGLPKREWYESVKLIPHLETRVCANNEITIEQAAGLPPKPVSLEFLADVDADKSGFIVAPDNEMAPTIREGDEVLVNLSDCSPANGLIYLVLKDGRVTIRRAWQTTDATWLLMADNPKGKHFLTQEAGPEHAAIKGRIRSVAKQL